MAILSSQFFPQVSLLTDGDVEAINNNLDDRKLYIIFSMSGLFSIRYDGSEYNSEMGVAVLGSPYQHSSFEPLGDMFQGYALVIDKAFIAEYQNLFEVCARTPLLCLIEEDAVQLLRLFRLIEASMSDEDSEYSLLEQKYLCYTLVDLVQRVFYIYDRWAININKNSTAGRFLALLKNHCGSERKLEFYAEKLNMSKKSLSAEVLSAMKKTASQLIEEETMYRARTLLKKKSLSIGEVSAQLNFRQCSDFSKYFKKNMNMTPMEYRKEYFKKH